MFQNFCKKKTIFYAMIMYVFITHNIISVFQKLLFCILKVILLHDESYPFAMQNNNF